MQKKDNKASPRGWEALKVKLQERGLTEVELEEAQDSFYRGIGFLAKLFLCCYLPERSNGKGIK